MKFVDCQCFAGGLAYSFVSEGFTLVAKREHPGGFGAPLMEANRNILGNSWDMQDTVPDEWRRPGPVEVVAGNPPCSGFSLLNSSGKRGIDSPINACMFHFMHFAAKCKPTTIVMESVQQAYTGGRPLMRKLRQDVEEISGLKYEIIHTLHSVAALDGSQIRRRYFLVLSRIPFGIDEREVVKCRTGYSFIEDLADKLLDEDGTPDGHITSPWGHADRTANLLKHFDWKQGEKIGAVLDRAFDELGFKGIEEKLGYAAGSVISMVLDDTLGSAYATTRVKANKLWPTFTGASMGAVHPTQPRTLTYREAARLMGFPDEWTVKPAIEDRKGRSWFGKGVTTFAGKWIAGLVRDAINGRPGPVLGDEIGERERYVNVSNLFVKPNKWMENADERE